MKIAVLSDIHGNLPALQVVAEHIDRWRPDAVYVAGDVVNRGPLSRACWEFVQARGWPIVRGNHEDYVSAWHSPDVAPDDPYYDLFASARWTFQQMGSCGQVLGTLPGQLSIQDPAGNEVRLTHGSMHRNDDGIYPWVSEDELRTKISPAPAVFIAGHTHQPFVRYIDETLIVNSGSVGTPFDGDVRASYAQLTWQANRWHGHIVRLPYDREQTRRDFYLSGFVDASGPLVRIILHEWEKAQGCFNEWAKQYEEAVVAGRIGLEASVDAFLAQR